MKLMILACIVSSYFMLQVEATENNKHNTKHHHAAMPRFLHSKLYHKLEVGTNFTAKIPAVLLENLHKKFHVNISFEVIQYDSKKVIHHKVRRINKNLVDIVFKLENVKQSDLGIYEVFMKIRHREANKKHPFGVNLQVCSVLLEDENLGNSAVVIVGIIVGVLLLTTFFAVVYCYMKQTRNVPFRRMLADDEQILGLNASEIANDDVFLPDVAHTSGVQMVAMTSLVDNKKGKATIVKTEITQSA